MTEAGSTTGSAAEACQFTRKELLGPAAGLLMKQGEGAASGAVCAACGDGPLEHTAAAAAADVVASPAASVKGDKVPLWRLGDVASRVLAEPLEVTNLLKLACEKPGELRRYTSQTALRTREAAAVRGCADPYLQAAMVKRFLEAAAARMSVKLSEDFADLAPGDGLMLSDVIADAAMTPLSVEEWVSLTAIVQLKAVGLGFLFARWKAEAASGVHQDSEVQVRSPDKKGFETWFTASRREDAETAALFFEQLQDAKSLAEVKVAADGELDFAVGCALAGHSYDRRSGDLAKLWREIDRLDGARRDRLALLRKDEVSNAKEAKKKREADARAEKQAELFASAAENRDLKRRRLTDEPAKKDAKATKKAGDPKKGKLPSAKEKEKEAVMAKPAGDRTPFECKRFYLCMVCRESGHLAAQCTKKGKKGAVAAADAADDEE
jgi:hypothetical protein